MTISRRLRRMIPAYVRGVLRRQAGQSFPTREAREYERWMARHLELRQALYPDVPEAGLLSVLTPVWDGSPVRYLKALADSLISQNLDGACEWIILDNGSSGRRLLSYLRGLRQHSWIKLHRVEPNTGIVRGLRHSLEQASGRYVLPVDADDYLYPDALQVIASYLRRTGYPSLLYSDEDKVIGTRSYQPYFKPDWDPVLLLNSPYTAHLSIINREKALDLDVYSDPETEGSPDWDVFVRFMLAGDTPVHIPEVLYSWRAHAGSTADHPENKPYVHASQKKTLQRFLDARLDPAKFSLDYSPCVTGAAHWRLSRCRSEPRYFASVVVNPLEADLKDLLPIARDAAKENGFVQFMAEDVQIDDPDWPWEALGVFELHPDTVMIGGRIRNGKELITGAGQYFGFAGVCGCPSRGSSFADPGYFAQMWKQRSVSAVSTQFAVVKAKFLLEVLNDLPREASLPFLGAWAGAHARRTGKRVVYSPFLSGVSELDWETLVGASELSAFQEMNRDIIPDRRYYSPYLSLEKPFTLCEAHLETANAIASELGTGDLVRLSEFCHQPQTEDREAAAEHFRP